MAKKVEIKKKTVNESSTERKQIELICKNAEMIMSSVKMAAIMQQMAKIGPEGITTSMVYVIGDFVRNMAHSLEIDQEAYFRGLIDGVRDYLKEETKTQGS